MTATNHPPGTGRCGICGDTGWALLNTTTQIGPHLYDDGVAPCHWCQAGGKQAERNPDLRRNYTLDDVVPYAEAETREQARGAYDQARAAVQAILERTTIRPGGDTAATPRAEEPPPCQD